MDKLEAGIRIYCGLPPYDDSALHDQLGMFSLRLEFGDDAVDAKMQELLAAYPVTYHYHFQVIPKGAPEPTGADIIQVRSIWPTMLDSLKYDVGLFGFDLHAIEKSECDSEAAFIWPDQKLELMQRLKKETP